MVAITSSIAQGKFPLGCWRVSKKSMESLISFVFLASDDQQVEKQSSICRIDVKPCAAPKILNDFEVP
jgi:hypothetical protein